MSSARLRMRRVKGDDGVGLVLVIGIVLFVTTIAVAACAFAVNGLEQSRSRSSFEQSLAAAENGLDATMSQLQAAFTRYNADTPIPSDSASPADPSPFCVAPKVTFPAVLDGVTVSDAEGNFFATAGASAEQNERAWARKKLEALRAVTGCVRRGGVGEFVVLKPVSTLVVGAYPKFGKIYSLGAVPSFSAAVGQPRLVKSEYVFLPYRPTNAVLTAGDLEFQGDLIVTGAAGVDPALASVHSNGHITVTGNSNVVTGSASSTQPSSATLSGHSIAQTPTQTIPVVSARDFYYQAPVSDPAAMSAWLDLCDDGHAKRWSASGPCTGATTATSNNWSWEASTKTWTANRDALPGTYFVYQANVKNGAGNATFTNFSVIAASKNPDNCSSKQYGNIDWDHFSIERPAFHGLWFYADADVAVTANIRLGSGATAPPIVGGLITSGDQIKLYTQSNSAVGAVVAADNCTTSPLVPVNQVHSDLYYDPDFTAPFTSIITNTLWLDYSA